MPQDVVRKVAEIQQAIADGANSFLFTEYAYMGVFMVSHSLVSSLFAWCGC